MVRALTSLARDLRAGAQEELSGVALLQALRTAVGSGTHGVPIEVLLEVVTALGDTGACTLLAGVAAAFSIMDAGQTAGMQDDEVEEQSDSEDNEVIILTSSTTSTTPVEGLAFPPSPP
jgi:hypothetical protein